MVTMSVGVAVARPGPLDTEELVGRADAALYAAKSGGRDRVAFDDKPAASDQEPGD
jgi:PleD family two-component response regulator